MNKSCRVRASLIAAAAIAVAVGETVAEPIKWVGGDWDERGAPKGKLLTDNEGWWGERVWTGVTYDYEVKPNSCADCLGGDAKTFGRRLLDGNAPTGWYRPVGMSGKPLVAIFDFKRPCRFAEFDLLSGWTTNGTVAVELSSDGTNWTKAVSAVASGSVMRVMLDVPAVGRFVKLSFRAATGAKTFLDEFLAWGEAEALDEYSEDVRPVPCEWAFPQSFCGAPKTHYDEAEFNEMSKGSATGIEIIEVTGAPDAIDCPLVGKTPERFTLRMARNETEARYFAVINATRATNSVAISVEGLGNGVSATALVGGVMRITPPARRLSEKEIFDLKLAGHEPPEQKGIRFAPLPFFEAKPAASLVRRHLANPEQVLGFPEAVPLRPGEAVVVMIRFRTESAAPGLCEGAMVVGKTRLPLSVEVADVTLPAPPVWIYAWSAFTRQFPFESKTRFDRDAQAVMDLGVSCFRGLPQKGTKPGYVFAHAASHTMFMCAVTCRSPFHDVYCCRRPDGLTDKDREILREDMAKTVDEAAALGLSLDRLVFDLPDEPGIPHARGVGEMAAFAKSLHPEVAVFCNPSFWTNKGFAGANTMIEHLGPWYNDYVDVSVPYRSHLEDAKKREALFLKPRRVNAQYAHPARRAGRSISWSSFRYGANGFAYWAYYTPRGNPWDIRTWKMYGYEALMVLPLGDGVAFTPSYEEMREAWEDYCLLTALREAGKKDVLEALLKEFGDSFDPPRMETARPYKCDFLELRDKALGAFCTGDSAGLAAPKEAGK